MLPAFIASIARRIIGSTIPATSIPPPVAFTFCIGSVKYIVGSNIIVATKMDNNLIIVNIINLFNKKIMNVKRLVCMIVGHTWEMKQNMINLYCKWCNKKKSGLD